MLSSGVGDIGGEKMKVQGDTIIFKSDPVFYFKERDGIKPNTAREFINKDEEAEVLEFFEKKKEIQYIQIHHSAYPLLCFKRRIRDISIIYLNNLSRLYIFSWIA